MLTGGFENRLVLYVNDDTDRTESLDIFTLERDTLFETKFHWHMLDSSNLYNYQNNSDRLEIYNLKSGKVKAFTRFDKNYAVKKYAYTIPCCKRQIYFYTYQT